MLWAMRLGKSSPSGCHVDVDFLLAATVAAEQSSRTTWQNEGFPHTIIRSFVGLFDIFISSFERHYPASVGRRIYTTNIQRPSCPSYAGVRCTVRRRGARKSISTRTKKNRTLTFVRLQQRVWSDCVAQPANVAAQSVQSSTPRAASLRHRSPFLMSSQWTWTWTWKCLSLTI